MRPLLLLFLLPVAGAHASLLQSDPPSGAILSHPPEVSRLTFSEPIEGTGSKVELVSPQGGVKTLSFHPREDSRTVEVPLPPLGNGSYILKWRVISQVDGHVTLGALPFAVGNATPSTTPSLESPLPPFEEILIQGASAGALLIGGGLLLFPLYAPLDERGARRVERVGRGLLQGAGFLALVEALLLSARLGGSVVELGVPRLVLLRGLILLGGPLLRGRGPPLLSSGIALLLWSLSGHARTIEPWEFGVALHIIHLSSASVWIGGVLALLLTKRGESIVRFSEVASWVVPLLVLSGSATAILHLRSWSDLGETPWGRVLLVKILLVFLVVALGAWNRTVDVPRLNEEGGRALRIQRRAKGELILGVGVVLGATLLSALVPPSTLPPPPLHSTDSKGGWVANLEVDPGFSGPNTVRVGVRNETTGDPLNASKALFRFVYLEKNLGATEIPATTLHEGVWGTSGPHLALPGPWAIQLFLERSGTPDLEFVFLVEVRPPP